ncbi:hypothetical protein BN2476_80014 [Paraburkholderia piptadeniae]|uniref:Uncharacterized protein n=1 Tax=Paraburkholderia piptadeniae TaxID=1701573 RepID=A0A1N7RLK5_9BURK|nr:hypothetical protein BN2476_80014 [Paraburkholderia piptadeniae]
MQAASSAFAAKRFFLLVFFFMMTGETVSTLALSRLVQIAFLRYIVTADAGPVVRASSPANMTEAGNLR